LLGNEQLFKAKIVQLILKKETDEAIKALSQHYSVRVPSLKVGMPKKYGRKAGCYVSQTRTIHVMSREKLEDPFVVLHEFYHHLRTHGGEHRGTERHADRFAKEFIEAFQTFRKYSFTFSISENSLSKSQVF